MATCRLGPLTKGAFLKSSQTTLPDSTSATSSPGSAAGRSPCGGLDSKALPESGPAPVPVSRFRARASARATPTSATFGPLFTTSSPSADLQRCLASRLQARMGASGSPEFGLIWKNWDMPAGEPICALRASERRTGDSGCSGWPTPMAGAKATEDYNEAGNTDSGRRTVELCAPWHTPTVRDLRNSGGDGKNPRCLVRQTALAAWPTPDTQTCGGAQDAEKRKAGGHNVRLQDAVLLTAWPTPSAAKNTKNSQDPQRMKEGGRQTCLADAAHLAGWATPRAEDTESAGMRHSRGVADTLTAQAGQGATSCHAATAKRGVLRPGHSRWLMGYPAAWDSCGATAMQSCRKSRRSS